MRSEVEIRIQKLILTFNKVINSFDVNWDFSRFAFKLSIAENYLVYD